MQGRRGRARVGERRGQRRRLRLVQLRGGDAEVGAARRVRAPHARAPLRSSEIELEDPVLGQRELEAQRGHRLLQLPQRIARRREVQVLRELLCDRARAAQPLAVVPRRRDRPHQAPAAVRAERVGDLGRLDAVMSAKPRILSDDDHALQQRRDVAVKVVDLGLTPSPSLAVRFVREARTVARLEHPHIVPIYKVGGYQNEVLYIVMRCVDGASLRQLLEKKQRLSVRKAATIARQVADALGYAHHYGVVHRDVKPDNILLDRGGHVLVTDFGIAKAAQEATVSQLTTEGMVVGTPQYMSPEQATGDKLDARSDIYSLGILLYQMLAGEPPFDGESAQSILMKQATADPPPIHDHRGDVPAPLTAALDRMLAKDPAERYQTAEAASRALVEAVPAAAGVTGPERAGMPRVAIRSVVGLVVLAAVGLVALTLLGTPPRLSVAAPIPDSVVQALRRQRVLAPGDVAQYVFNPAGADDTTFLIVARR